MKLIVALLLVQLTGPEGGRIDVNPHRVTSIREPRGVATGHWAPGTRCLVVMSSGKFIAVHETCAVVRERLLGPRAIRGGGGGLSAGFPPAGSGTVAAHRLGRTKGGQSPPET